MDSLDDRTPSARAPSRGPLFYAGAGGLLTVMVTETLSVLGRHLGHPLLGAIEIIQSEILVAACAAMVNATKIQAHATVHLVIDHLSAPARSLLLRASACLSALFFAGLVAGSLWLAADFSRASPGMSR